MDMAGNVWEWIYDWYDENTYKKSVYNNPAGPVKGKYKVMCGGSWYDITWLTKTNHYWNVLGDRYSDLGFRCVVSYRRIINCFNTCLIKFTMKRILIATTTGLITGIICYLSGRYGLKDEINTTMFFYIIANRTLAGFFIGISGLRMSWYLHGLLIGFITGIPFSIGTLLNDPCIAVFTVSLILGAVYGLIIELFTSFIFKQGITGKK